MRPPRDLEVLERRAAAIRARREAEEREERERELATYRQDLECFEGIVARLRAPLVESADELDDAYTAAIRSEAFNRLLAVHEDVTAESARALCLPFIAIDWASGRGSFADPNACLRGDAWQWLLGERIELRRTYRGKFATDLERVARFTALRAIGHLDRGLRKPKDGWRYTRLTDRENDDRSTWERRAAIAVCGEILVDAIRDERLLEFMAEEIRGKLRWVTG